jgi:putative membrane protein
LSRYQALYVSLQSTSSTLSYPTTSLIESIPVAAYIIFGFAFIGEEIENPFGNDVNDLPLDSFCNQLAADIDVIAASRPQKSESFVKSKNNRIMAPLNKDGYDTWKDRSVDEIREALRKKSVASGENVKARLRSHYKTDKEDWRYERVRASGAQAV